MADVYEALADPTRRRILDLVGARERSVSDLVEACSLPQPAISKRLRVLHEAGLVKVRPDGPWRLYSLRPGPLIEVRAWLEQHVARWDLHLDHLEQSLDEDEEEGRT